MVIKSFSDYASEATSNPPSYYIPSTPSQSSHLESTTTSSAPSEQPPAFQFYKPKTYSISKAKQRDINQNNALDWLPDPIGDVLTHDPHLNDDGELILRRGTHMFTTCFVWDIILISSFLLFLNR